MRKLFGILAAIFLTISVARAQQDAQAEAVQRGVSVQQVQLERAQARIAQLEKELANLRAQTKPAATPSVDPSTGTAPAQEHPLLALINSMPKNLWRTSDETAVKEQARDAWWAVNVKEGLGPFSFSGKLSYAHLTTAPDGKTKKVTVSVKCLEQIIHNQSTTISLTATLDNVKTEDAIDWKEGSDITVTGTLQRSYLGLEIFGGPHLDVYLKEARKD